MVGADGRVIGVDMTQEMITTSRANASEAVKQGLPPNTSFRLGEIEYLPVADNSVDCIISNCVVNLSMDQPQVYKEAFRVLKPGELDRLLTSDRHSRCVFSHPSCRVAGGRICNSDVVQLSDDPMPAALSTAEAQCA